MPIDYGDLVPSGPAQSAPAAQPAATVDYSDLEKPYNFTWLPLSTDAQGGFHPAVPGILRSLWGAVTLPGDIYTGKTPALVQTDSGQITANPEVVNRSIDLATLATPINPAIRAGDLAIPGIARAQAVPASVAVPTAQELKAAGASGYDTARESNMLIQGNAVSQAADAIKNGLQQTFVGEKLAPKTFSILNDLASPPQAAGAVGSTVRNLMEARQALGKITGDEQEIGAAGIAKRGLDDFLETLDPAAVVAGTAARGEPQAIADTLRTANANYAAARRSNLLTGELDRANTGVLDKADARAAAANSGQNLDNAIRSRVASLLENQRKTAGFSDPEIEALNNLVAGGRLQNALRWAGNFFGGGGGLGQMAVTGAGTGLGYLLAGPKGMAIGSMAAPAVGMVTKQAENALARRGLLSVDETLRMRSPLYQQSLGGAPMAVPHLGFRYAPPRALGLGLLAPPEQ